MWMLRLEAIASRLEAIALRLEAIFVGIQLYLLKFGTTGPSWHLHYPCLLLHRS